MKALFLLVAVGICETTWADDRQQTKATGARTYVTAAAAKITPRAPSGAAASGCWCRTADGRRYWVPAPPSARNGSSRRTASYTNEPATVYGPDGHPVRIGGIDWYLNGRGPFSD
jgi:hypothetical protein